MTSAAVKNVTDQRKAEEKARDEAAKTQAKRQEIEGEFSEAVAKAAEKRKVALAKLDTGSNIAETAWNDTKADEDPTYDAVAADFRRKLDTVLEAVKTTGNADVVGLEAYEARCIELLEAAGTPAGTIAPFVAGTDGRSTDTAEEVADTDKKAGRSKASK